MPARCTNRFRISATVITTLATVLAALTLLSPARAAQKINWKPVGDAILKITGRKPPKTWSVYQDEKKKQRVLVEIDNRYLILDAKTKQVYEITVSQLQLHGKVFQSSNPAANERALPSADWDIRDIGPAERIQVRLTDEKIFLDVELPHPLNLRTVG